MDTQIKERYGASKSVFDVSEKPNLSFSKFNYSAKHNTTIDIGGIYPVDFFRVFPNDRVKLNARFMLDTLPLAVPPLNNYKIQFHYYYISMNGLWKGWDSFITKGASGVIDKQIPSFVFHRDNTSSVGIPITLPSSLASYLGIPVIHSISDYSNFPAYLPWQPDLGFTLNPLLLTFSPAFSSVFSYRVNCLPFLFYQKIYRDNYCPIDLCRDSKVWYPDDLSDEWRIDYSASNLSQFDFIPSGSFAGIGGSTVPSPSDKTVSLVSFRYACFNDDYFVSAKPWLVRGVEANLQSDIVLPDLPIDVLSTSDSDSSVWMKTGANKNLVSGVVKTSPDVGDSGELTVNWNKLSSASRPTVGQGGQFYVDLLDISSKLRTKAASSPVTLDFTANTLRNLLAISVWQERSALAKGRYNALTKAHWGISPKHPEYEPRYLGGTSVTVNFGKVLSTADTDKSPLAQPAGVGSANGQSFIFDEHFNDFGYIMCVAIVTPETYYCQGLDRVWTDLRFDDQFQPEFAKLGFQPILNQELYLQGKKGSNADNDLYGYTTSYSWLKTRQNRVSGMFALPPDSDLYFNAYTQKRWFDSVPKLSAEFVTMLPQNINRDFLAYPSLPAFILQFASDVELVRALPYQSSPETFGF